jgi:chromosome segregation ATPase
MSKFSSFFLVLVLLCSAGMYGCTQQKNSATGTKLHELETRFAKLEEDYRTISATNDANRKKLTQLEAQKAELTTEVEKTTQERDELRKEREELRKQLLTRTGERDTVQAQLTQFRQDLQSLVARVDAAINTSGASVTPVTAVPASRKSE